MHRLSIILLAVLAVSIVSCGGKTQPDGGVDSDSVATDSVVTEAVPLAKLQTENMSVTRKLGRWEFKADVAYPTEGPEALLNGIRQRIAEDMVNSDGEKSLRVFSGDKSDGKAMLDYYAQAFLKSINYDDYVDLPDDVSCSCEYTIKPEYENDSIVTFSYQYYVYSGGAHGGCVSYGVSFRKSDGKRLGWNMIASKKALQPEIKKGLKENFEVKTDDELRERLMVIDEQGNDAVDMKNLPLPQTEPWIGKNGLNFIYQQYEIASYAEGMPGFVIPTSRLSKYLTKEAQTLIK